MYCTEEKSRDKECQRWEEGCGKVGTGEPRESPSPKENHEGNRPPGARSLERKKKRWGNGFSPEGRGDSGQLEKKISVFKEKEILSEKLPREGYTHLYAKIRIEVFSN